SLDKEIVMAKYKSKIDSDKEDAGRVMAQGTPTFFVNGRMVFELGYEPIKAAVDRALAESDQ
ncbi:MAG: DsbA family protein, partial [Bdellovibrionota bacterium]